MITLAKIAAQRGYSMRWMRELARGGDFPPPRRIGGKTARLKLYDVEDVKFWWTCRVLKPRGRPASRRR